MLDKLHVAQLSSMIEILLAPYKNILKIIYDAFSGNRRLYLQRMNCHNLYMEFKTELL